MINNFAGKYDFLSNFYVEFDGKTLEHRYQAAKCVKQSDALYIMSLPTPGQAKRAGRNVELRDEWEEVKVQVMTGLVMVKFFSSFDMMKKLDDTGVEELVEGNNWHDNCWGACICDRCKPKKKHNCLGIILMQVRSSVRTVIREESPQHLSDIDGL